MEHLSRLAGLPHGRPADMRGQPLPEVMAEWVNNLPQSLLEVVTRIAEAGGGVWVVGGSVRQGLSATSLNDYDLASELSPDELLALFPSSLPTGVKYGTITVRLHKGGEMYEVTTLRSEQDYSDGRRPEKVTWGDSLRVDLQRRDLTINAMAVDLARAELYDPFGGYSDLQNGVLRAVGDAQERLGEDGLRIMRVYRFMDQGEAGVWQPEESLANALITNLEMLKRVSVERIWQEFRKILLGPAAADILARMAADGVLAVLLPNSKISLVGQRELKGLTGGDIVVARLALLLFQSDAKKELLNLKIDGKTIDGVVGACRHLGLLPNPHSEAELRLFAASLGDLLPRQLAIETAFSPESARPVTAALSELSADPQTYSPLIDGEWLMANLEMKSGLRLGRLKDWLHRIQVERELTTIEEVARTLDEIEWRTGDPRDWPRMTWP